MLNRVRFSFRSLITTQYPRRFATKENKRKQKSTNKLSSTLQYDSEIEHDQSSNLVDRTPELSNINVMRFERAITLHKEGDDYINREDFVKAEECYTQCIGIFGAYIEYKYGDLEDQSEASKQLSELTLDPSIALAYAQQCQDNLEAAEETYKQIFTLLDDVKVDDEKYLKIALNYGELLCHLEKPLLAADTLRSALDRKSISKKSLLYASAIGNLSIYYAVVKDYEKGLPLAKESYELFKKHVPANSPDASLTEISVRQYIRMLNDSGNSAEAEQVQNKWDELRKSANLPTISEMDINISQHMNSSFENINNPNVAPSSLNPDEILESSEFYEKQKNDFVQKDGENTIDFDDPNFVDKLAPELKAIYNMTGRANEFESDMKKFKENPELAKKMLAQGIETPLTTFSLKKE